MDQTDRTGGGGEWSGINTAKKKRVNYQYILIESTSINKRDKRR